MEQKPIAIYYRVSTDSQTTAMQRKAVTDWLTAQQPRPKYRVFEDLAKSGKDDRRPEFNKMLRACIGGEFSAVVCYRLDRFSRSASSAIRTILDLDDAGVGFVAVDQPALNLGRDVPFRNAILAIFAELAQIERETIVKRVKEGMAAAKEAGVRIGRPPSANEDRRNQVRQFYSQGLSVRNIAKKCELSPSTVHRILKAG